MGAETALFIMWVALALLTGIVGGIVLHSYAFYNPLRKRNSDLHKDYNDLIKVMIGMKKRGFVQQYDIEQVKEADISKGIREF